jgi:hypothetical protein
MTVTYLKGNFLHEVCSYLLANIPLSVTSRSTPIKGKI